MADEQLDGGLANAGRVTRDGRHVLRPATAHSVSIHAYLRALGEAGFDGAPRPVGIDGDGRERLLFIAGDVPTVPYPPWSQTDRALASVARLLRRLHGAGAGFDPSGHAWSEALADPAGGSIVCHNDLEPSNIVFRHGVAVGFIDFEFAAPGRPVYDLAQLARLCLPVEHEIDRNRMGWATPARPARLRLLADAYGLDRGGRAELVTALDDAIDRIEAAARTRFGLGQARADRILAETGGIEKYDRRRRWWQEHRHEFADALR